MFTKVENWYKVSTAIKLYVEGFLKYLEKWPESRAQVKHRDQKSIK